MRFSILSHYFFKSLVLCFIFVLVLSFQVPNYSYSSTDNSNFDNSSMQTSENSENNTASFNLDSSSNSTANTTVILTPNTAQ